MAGACWVRPAPRWSARCSSSRWVAGQPVGESLEAWLAAAREWLHGWRLACTGTSCAGSCKHSLTCGASLPRLPSSHPADRLRAAARGGGSVPPGRPIHRHRRPGHRGGGRGGGAGARGGGRRAGGRWRRRRAPAARGESAWPDAAICMRGGPCGWRWVLGPAAHPGDRPACLPGWLSTPMPPCTPAARLAHVGRARGRPRHGSPRQLCAPSD